VVPGCSCSSSAAAAVDSRSSFAAAEEIAGPFHCLSACSDVATSWVDPDLG